MSQCPLIIIQNLERTITNVLQNFSWSAVFKLYKNSCKQLLFSASILKFPQKNSIKLKKAIYECLYLIMILVNFAEQSKFSHRLPLFSYILEKYQKQNQIKIYSLGKDIQLKFKARVKQNNYRYLNQASFSINEQYMLKETQINNTIHSICKYEINLHHAQCIGCSQILVKGFQINNYNPYFPIIVGIAQKQYSQLNLQRYICAVSNQGGGIIIIGAERKNNQLIANGIKFKQKSQVQGKLAQIYSAITSIHPTIYAYVQNIVVQTNFIQKDNIEEERLRFCFRIIIFAQNYLRKQYIQFRTKGYHSNYQVYQLDSSLKPQKVVSTNQSNCSTFYDLAFQYYLKNKKLIKNKLQFFNFNTHNKIRCQKPLMQYSKIFDQYIQDKKLNIQDVGSQQNKTQIEHEDEPRFKHQYSSLLVVGSKNKDKYIKQFVNVLKSKKVVHGLEKPFENSFKEGSRSIWLLSHVDHPNVIRPFLKQFDKGLMITLIPVFKTLQIDQRLFTQQKHLKFDQTFKSRYPQGYDIDQLNKQVQHGLIKCPILLNFNSYNHAIFGYLIFQSFQLRPFFVKQNTTYKKKNKNKLYQVKEMTYKDIDMTQFVSK